MVMMLFIEIRSLEGGSVWIWLLNNEMEIISFLFLIQWIRIVSLSLTLSPLLSSVLPVFYFPCNFLFFLSLSLLQLVMKIPKGCLVVLERGECGCPDLRRLNWYCSSSATWFLVIMLMKRVVWGLSHFLVMGNVRTWRCSPFPQSLCIFRAAKRRLGSAETPLMNKCSGVKPLPGKLPKGQWK